MYVTLGLLLVTAVYYSMDRIHLTYSYSPDLRGQEKNVVYGIQHAINDLPSLYRRIDSPPFAFIQYTPIYYYICAALAKAFQLTPGKNLHDIYVLCRQLNIFLNLCSSFLVFYILFVILKSRWEIALLAGILLLLSSQSHSWAIRPDPLKNVFFLLSLLFYLVWIQNRKIIPAFLSSLSVALAIFTKQDMVVLAMAYLFFAFFYAGRKEFLQYLGVLSGLGIAGLGIFTIIHGVSIWENLYWAVNN
ncbi:MAG: hypothetical protein K2Q22_02375, partial [Cytophagales bacterium]|nr:hypothetical protein [Cytophagales bacterium]